MSDVEGNTVPSLQNPYTSSPPPPLPPYVDRIKRFIYIAISAYGLRYFRFLKVVLKSPHIRHEWFQIGLALTIGKDLLSLSLSSSYTPENKSS
jgi:hypothetical protein